MLVDLHLHQILDSYKKLDNRLVRVFIARSLDKYQNLMNWYNFSFSLGRNTSKPTHFGCKKTTLSEAMVHHVFLYMSTL